MSLSCEVCYEFYAELPTERQPRALPICGHDFCTRCIAALLADERHPPCPKCRSPLILESSKPSKSDGNASNGTENADVSAARISEKTPSSFDSYLRWPVLRCLLQLDERMDFGSVSNPPSMSLLHRALQAAPTAFLQIELEQRKRQELLDQIPLELLQQTLERRKTNEQVCPSLCQCAGIRDATAVGEWPGRPSSCYDPLRGVQLSPLSATSCISTTAATEDLSPGFTNMNHLHYLHYPYHLDRNMGQSYVQQFSHFSPCFSQPMWPNHNVFPMPIPFTPYPAPNPGLSWRRTGGVVLRNFVAICILLWRVLVRCLRWLGSVVTYFKDIGREQQLQLVMIANAIPLIIGSFYVFHNPTFFIRFRSH